MRLIFQQGVPTIDNDLQRAQHVGHLGQADCRCTTNETIGDRRRSLEPLQIIKINQCSYELYKKYSFYFQGIKNSQKKVDH